MNETDKFPLSVAKIIAAYHRGLDAIVQLKSDCAGHEANIADLNNKIAALEKLIADQKALIDAAIPDEVGGSVGGVAN